MKKILAILLCLCCINLAQAKVKPNSVSDSFVEGQEYSIKGKNLHSGSNPFTATVITAGGIEVALPTAVNAENNEARFVIPTVAQDLKVTLRFSGGNVPTTSPQDFLALILNKPEGFKGSNNNTISETPNIPADAQSGFFGGPQGPQGNPGGPGNQGPGGPTVSDGGELDADSLPIEIVFGGPTLVTGDGDGNVNLGGADFFIVTDSNTDSINSFSTISGATGGIGSTVRILFQTEVFVYDSDFPEDGEINLSSDRLLKGITRDNNARVGFYGAQLFGPGDTLKLTYDGNAWYEVSRSTNTLVSRD